LFLFFQQAQVTTGRETTLGMLQRTEKMKGNG
jgi:hypothetical protein